MTGSGFIVLAATLSSVGMAPVAGRTNELDMERLGAGLNNETWEKVQEPEMVLDKKTEHRAVGR